MYSREYLLRVWEIHHGDLSERHRRAFLARPELQRLMPLPREVLDRAFRANRRLVDIDAAVTAERESVEKAQAEEQARRIREEEALSDWLAVQQARSERAAREAEARRERAARESSKGGVARSREWLDREDELSELVWLMVDGPGHEYPEDARLDLYGKGNLDGGGSRGSHTTGRDGPYGGGYPFDARNQDDAR